ncbi:MAG TPA: hypothetical protein VNY75_01230 [Rhizomicrobium sp.]|nr:hypothetical protein [Rhizomicrobium sp.]
MKKVFALMAALVLSACASAAGDAGMTVTSASASLPQVQAGSSLRNAITVGSITGGKKTLPFWKSEVGDSEFGTALKNSLGNVGLLATAGRYHLDVVLTDMDQPLIALDTTVTSTAHYSLTDNSAGRVVFDQTIKADFTAKLMDQPIGFVRLKRANEGSIRHNIELFLQALAAASI